MNQRTLTQKEETRDKPLICKMEAKWCSYPDFFRLRSHGNGSITSTNRYPGPDPSFASSAVLASRDMISEWLNASFHGFLFCLQPRDTCYVASSGLPVLGYSGYQPHAYSWDEFPLLKDILEAVLKAFPGSGFNSLLLNRYKGGNDYVGWHADDEKLYGSTPEIASVSFGCDREFLLKKKPSKIPQVQPDKRVEGEPPSKRSKKNSQTDQHSFTLKHGSLLLMRGYTQRDWVHSVPKRAKADATRINLTFRRVV